MNKKILIIDDDEKLNRLLTDYFANYNFNVDSVLHPADGLEYLKTKTPDIIILDIMLPDINGFDVCKKIRKKYSVPIIMLTARGEVADRIVGLELGADDYLPKPFEPRELVTRIQVILRRNKESVVQDIRNYGNLKIDFIKHTVSLENNNLNLTSMEFEILKIFVNNPGRVFNRDQIMNNIKGIDWSAYDRSIDVLISRLRQKLNDDPKDPKFIKTIWGSGYLFIGNET